VQCSACPHRAVVKPTALGMPLATLVPRAGANLICSACGSKRVLTYPESKTRAKGGSGNAVLIFAGRERRGPSNSLDDMAKQTILIVDDEPLIRVYVRQVIEDAGHLDKVPKAP
jgi:hypothetical protein